MCIDSLIICYVCRPHTHIIRDYKRSNPCVNTGLILLLYVCVAHTHEPNSGFNEILLLITWVTLILNFSSVTMSCCKQNATSHVMSSLSFLAGEITGFQPQQYSSNVQVTMFPSLPLFCWVACVLATKSNDTRPSTFYVCLATSLSF